MQYIASNVGGGFVGSMRQANKSSERGTTTGAVVGKFILGQGTRKAQR